MTDENHEPSQFETEPTPEPEHPQGPAPGEPASTGIAWGAILLLLGIGLVVVFAVQNTAAVPVKFLWMEGRFALAVVILITVGVIIVLTELIALSYRRRRRRRIVEREELRRYRGA